MKFLVEIVDVGAPYASHRALTHWTDVCNRIMLGDTAILAATPRKKPSALQIQFDLVTITWCVALAIKQTNRRLALLAAANTCAGRANWGLTAVNLFLNQKFLP